MNELPRPNAAMLGYVVQVASVGGHAAPLRYYVVCDEQDEAIRLLRTTFARDCDWDISILRPISAWEMELFRLSRREIRQAP